MHVQSSSGPPICRCTMPDHLLSFQASFVAESIYSRLHLLQADSPLEKQINRWRQEVFKLLLSNKQAERAHQQQGAAHASAIATLESKLAAAEDRATLLDSRLLDRHVDLELDLVKFNRAEDQLQQAQR